MPDRLVWIITDNSKNAYDAFHLDHNPCQKDGVPIHLTSNTEYGTWQTVIQVIQNIYLDTAIDECKTSADIPLVVLIEAANASVSDNFRKIKDWMASFKDKYGWHGDEIVSPVVNFVGEKLEENVSEEIRNIASNNQPSVCWPWEILQEPNFIKETVHVTGRQRRYRSMVNFFIGQSDEMLDALDCIERLAALDNKDPILITGSPGAGKGTIAKSIRKLHPRRKKAWVEQNMTELTEQEYSEKMYGNDRYNGLVEQAKGGLMFMDEVGNMSLSAQAKLLVLLQDKKYRSPKDNLEKECDVKFIVGINRNPREAIDQEKILRDLYRRVSPNEIRIPDLKDRKEEIYQLLKYCNETLKDEKGHKLLNDKWIGIDLIELMREYDWPENVSQFIGALKSAAIKSGKNPEIKIEDFPIDIRDAFKSIKAKRQAP